MRVYIGSDHAGYELKERLLGWLAEHGHDAVDCGPKRLDPDDDYPPFCIRVGEGVVVSPGSLGVVIGGSGNGEQIAANKVRGVRAALAWSDDTARLSREHNDANVLALGARMVDPADAVRFVELFLTTSFSAEPRHSRRIRMLGEYERTGQAPPLP
ncbi:MAG: ribose-5-phosphate isomerase [Streptosporangiales bacterium]|nr:ribose-5-phosphate isomerase [Streptosporangiales bacterium]MBO0890205.1 ribose-5-phosphate isomerase [Acidothermales bacterium]